MEFTLPAPLGAQATIAAQQPTRQAPDPTRVEKAPTTGKTRADAHNTQEHGNTPLGQNSADPDAPPPDPDQPVGPPPTFQMNVLEMERELQQRLAAIELSRSLSDEYPVQNASEGDEDPALPRPDRSD